MSEYDEMLQRIRLDSILGYLMYGTEESKIKTETFQIILEQAYDTIFEKLEKMYPSANKQNDELLGALMDFSTIHNEIYFEMGLIIGFQIYKNFERGYRNFEGADLQELIKKNMSANRKMEKNK